MLGLALFFYGGWTVSDYYDRYRHFFRAGATRAADELALPRALRAGFKSVDRLIDALVDPARREKTALVLLAVYAVIWTLYGVLAKAGQNV